MDGEAVALLLAGSAAICGMGAAAWWVLASGKRLLADAGDEAARAASWTRTLGKVDQSAVRDRTYRAGKYRVIKAAPAVSYSYEAGGRRHHGTRIRFGIVEFNRRSNAARLADRYPKGAVVPVLYDPDDPARSVLEPRVHLPGLAWACRAGALILAASGLYIGGSMIAAATRFL